MNRKDTGRIPGRLELPRGHAAACARAAIVLAGSLAIPGPVYGLTINFTNLGGVGAGTNALAGFTAAANVWESHLADDITVNISVKYGTTDINNNTYGGSTLGSASSLQQTNSYTSFRNAVTLDATTANDGTATSSLQGGASFGLLINRTANSPGGAGSATPYLDNDGDANNGTMWINRANAKAIGLLGAHEGANDASIGFNSNFAFDFDQSDGITGGQYDFTAVALHEIGHALGFVSGVDVLDYNSSGPYYNDNLFTFVSPLDLFRFSVDSVALMTLDWTADSRTKYFSIDGGATSLGGFSTGVTWGDGRQASHWKDNQGLGLMDPTLASGQLGMLSSLDLLAMDVIGYDPVGSAVVPVPAGVWLFSSGLALLSLVRRR